LLVYSTFLFVHVLLFVFWLGTDVGVFLAAKISERADLSGETRATVLKLGMVLDRMPRSALTLIVPTGLQLAIGGNLLAVPGFVLPLVWVVSLIWLAILWVGFLNPETETEKRSMIFSFIMHIIMAVIVNGFAIYLIVSAAAPLWLSIKILMVGLIYITGVSLDLFFKPAVEAFFAIITEGGSAEKNAAFSKAMGPVYKAVLLIYLLVLIAAYMGVTKPAF
jgi:hypothetical protein